MYTYNLLCFGINPKKIDMESINEIDYEFVNSDKYSVESHYHGGSDTIPYTIGKVITDDSEEDYINFVRTLREEDYIEDFNKFKSELLFDLGDKIKSEYDLEVIEILSKFKIKIEDSKAEFYSIEVSS